MKLKLQIEIAGDHDIIDSYIDRVLNDVMEGKVVLIGLKVEDGNGGR